MNLLRLRVAAIAVSACLHALLLLQAGGATSASEAPAKTQSVTRLSFSQPAPTPESIPEQPQPEPEIKPEPKPQPEKALKKARTEPENKKPEPTPPEQMVAAAPAAAPAKETPQLDDGVIQSKTKAYLAAVIAHIERHKWYPKAARRRGIQGHIEVAFMLFPDGSARIIEVTNGPEILIGAARKTMERAAPLPAPPPDIHCPLKCSFRMQFSLDAT